jgi:LacI family transcriptional regulator
MGDMKTVAVFLDKSAKTAADLHRGIARFARTRDDWTLMHMGTHRVRAPLDPRARQADGVLLSTAFADANAIKALVASGIPAVNMIQTTPPLRLSAVCPDNEAAGQSAAEHLLSLGLHRFGYVQLALAWDDGFRLRGFSRALLAMRAQCAVKEFPALWDPSISAETISAVAQWVRSIGCPCGILVFCDELASQFMQAVRAAGLRVPEDVAVVGIDDNDVLCEYCNPALSSVNLNDQVVAYEAAAMLDQLMRSRRRSAPAQMLIPPIGVIERGSSQMLAVEDDVARVLNLMVNHFDERLTVRQMAQHVNVSPRTLEMKFQRALGRTPSEEMARLRIERAKRLLIDTETSIVQIAHDAGFANAGHFCHCFKVQTKMTPGQYRRGMRGDTMGRR